jgi:hypothetical protein
MASEGGGTGGSGGPGVTTGGSGRLGSWMAHWESDSFGVFCWARAKVEKSEEKIKKQITKAKFLIILFINSSILARCPQRTDFYGL